MHASNPNNHKEVLSNHLGNVKFFPSNTKGSHTNLCGNFIHTAQFIILKLNVHNTEINELFYNDFIMNTAKKKDYKEVEHTDTQVNTHTSVYFCENETVLSFFRFLHIYN